MDIVSSTSPLGREIEKANFIAGAIEHPGALHEALGVPQGKKIPRGQIEEAAKQPGHLGRMARFALTLEGISKEETLEEDGLEADAEFGVTKSLDEKRYTFGPLYSPGQLDAHGEFTTSDELQKAVWNFARTGARSIHKQHNRDKKVGEVVEIATWPQEVVTKMTIPGRDPRDVTLPAGTAYVGVIWSKEAWPLVKSGAISGYSLGGRGVRVHGLPEEGLSRMRKASEDEGSD